MTRARSPDLASLSTSFPQQTCKPDAEPVRISDGEITQTIIAIGNWNDDLCADFVHERPVFVDVGDHHTDVSDWKGWCCAQGRATRVAECGELSKKKAVIFPGQFHEIAAVSKEFESQTPVKVDGEPYVPYHNLRHELLSRIHISAHGGLISRTAVQVALYVKKRGAIASACNGCFGSF